MLICPHCSAKVADNPALASAIVVCPRCAGKFQLPPLPSPPAADPASRFLPDDKPPPVSIRTKHWPTHLAKRNPASTKTISTLLAVFLSFLLPGLGQVTQGRVAVGAGFMIGAIACWCLGLVSVPVAWVVAADPSGAVAVAQMHNPFWLPAFLIGIVVTLWSMVDAGAH